MIRRLFAMLTSALAAPGEGRSPLWPRARAEHLRKEPRCAACGGTECLQVHHILPVSWPGGPERELSPANLITLCESPGRNCHLWWGHLGDFRARNEAAVEDAASFLTKVKARPCPPAA